MQAGNQQVSILYVLGLTRSGIELTISHTWGPRSTDSATAPGVCVCMHCARRPMYAYIQIRVHAWVYVWVCVYICRYKKFIELPQSISYLVTFSWYQQNHPMSYLINPGQGSDKNQFCKSLAWLGRGLNPWPLYVGIQLAFLLYSAPHVINIK